MITPREPRQKKGDVKVCDCGKIAMPKRMPSGFTCEDCYAIELVRRNAIYGKTQRALSCRIDPTPIMECYKVLGLGSFF